MCAGPLLPASIARQFHSFGMVAASSGGSNVPPDDLQAAPVLGFVPRSNDEFGVRPRTGRRHPQPGKPRHDQAARAQPRGLPGAVTALPVDGPAGCDAQDPARGISVPERQPFVAANTNPDQGNEPFETGGNGQQDYACETGQEQQGAAQQDEATQARIRRDVGGE